MIQFKLLLSEHQKCKELIVTYGKWSLKRVKLQEVFYEKKSRHVYFFREIVLHAAAVF